MRIIMALDIIDGKCVRLARGDYETAKIYGSDPLAVAKNIENNGLRYLHLVDLDGAKSGKIINYRILEEISSGTKLIIDFSGGLRSEEDIRIAFSAGAEQVTAGTIAVSEPSLFMEWLDKFGSDRLILGADFRNRMVVTGAWTETSGEDIVSFISGYWNLGVRYSVCTDVERDGMMNGPAIEIYKEILSSAPVNLIASGGISSLKDIDEIRLAGCEGAIIGKSVYEGKIKLRELGLLC